MSRHRNVRNLTEDDYYDEYDDDYFDEDDYYYEEEDEQYQQQQQQPSSTITATVTPKQTSIQQPQQQKKQQSLEEKEAALMEMGFSKAQATTALSETKGDVARATDLLVRTAAAMSSFDMRPPSITEETSKPSVAAVNSTDDRVVAPPTAPPPGVKSAPTKTSRTPSKSPPPPSSSTPTPATTPLPKIPTSIQRKIQSNKSRLTMCVFGHVDAGKSTLMGQVLLQLDHVSKRTIQKYQKQATQLGKASFHLAWVMDEDESERERGVTMDVALKEFSTPHHNFTLLDAPGHAAFVPNMIAGAASAQVGILVVAATRGEFEAGFLKSTRQAVGGQTREHVVLARGLGVSQLVVAVNKLDAVDWSQERFEEIRALLTPFLVDNGFSLKRIQSIPVSGLTGVNVKDKPGKDVKLSEWYSGPTLLEAIDSFAPAQRNVDKPLRIIVTDVFMEGKYVTCKARIVQGVVQVSEKLVVLPIGDEAVVSRIGVEGEDFAMAGDTVDIALSGIDIVRVAPGCILSHTHLALRPPIRKRMQAKVLVMENLQVPIIRGAQVLFHQHSIDVPAVISKLIAITKRDGTIQKERPRVITGGASALVEITLQERVCLESFADCRALGRFVLRRGGDSIAVGIIEQVL